MLDVARRTYLDTIEKIHEVVHAYKENLGIPIRLNYTYVLRHLNNVGGVYSNCSVLTTVLKSTKGISLGCSCEFQRFTWDVH
jgi:hypothetical protein